VILILDTSALVAILAEEPEADAFAEAIRNADQPMISALTVLEFRIVMLGRRGPGGLEDARDLITAIGAEIIPSDNHMLERATSAYARYGKGIHPQARLNMGDCAAYGLARALNAPLLFKGEDFAATDISPALQRR
jgi:ribonuclease VapC